MASDWTPKRRTLRPDVKPKTRGDLYIEFWQTLPSPDDPSRRVTPDDFQINFFKALLDPEIVDEHGDVIRAIRQAILTMARKNGKTTMASGLVLGFLVGPLASYNQQLFSVAFEREQAALTYNIASSVVIADDELSRLIRCVDSSKSLACAYNHSKFRSLSAEYRSKHGLNPALVIFDELAQFGTNRQLFDTMATSMGAQKQPLMLTISTQAANNEAVLSQMIDYGREVNAGRLEDPSFLLVEYSTPPDEELAAVGKSVWDEEVWAMANPALGSFRSLAEMREMSKKAKKIPSVELTFRNLYLNQRVAAHALFVSPAVWERCNGWPESPDELEGRQTTIAIDLSARTDLTAISAATVLDSGKKVLETYAFTPADTLDERSIRDRAPYINWVKQGYITATPGNTVSYEFVAKKLLELCQTRDVRAVVFDRWRFDQFKKVLLDMDPSFDEELLKPFGQGYKDMSPAVDTMEEALLNQEIMHGGHPVLRWAFANAVLEQDAAGNKKLTKAKSYGRIDPAVAAVMAIGAIGMETIDTSSMIGLL